MTGTDAFLLSRVLLQFETAMDGLITNFSAVAQSPDNSLWLGSDEGLTLERLSPIEPGVYGQHQSFAIADYFNLADHESEIDIEGLDYADGYLWLVGSHSVKRKKPKGKKTHKDIQRLSETKIDANRYLLGRIPVVDGQLVKTGTTSWKNLSAAALPMGQKQSPLIESLLTDPHLSSFLQMGLPSKDNGFDIEGLAVHGKTLFLGLRGPVLNGWALMLEIMLDTDDQGDLQLQKIGPQGETYRKHFLDLNGLGIRELCWCQDDLLILAGPTMCLFGPTQIFRLTGAAHPLADTLWSQSSDRLTHLVDLPYTPQGDNAEGLLLYPYLGETNSVLILHDSPVPARFSTSNSLFADIYRLPAEGC